MNVFITGINGFIGKNLKNYFSKLGHTVFGSVSKKENAEESLGVYFINLEGECKETIFKSIDTIIHLAYDRTPGSMETNINGTIEIALKAQKAGVSRQVFVSSYSAFSEARSEYGKAKFILESYFHKNKHSIIRPGLVLGSGGLSARISNLVEKFPIIPLLGGGTQPIPIITIKDLSSCISEILINERPDGEWNLFYEDFSSLRELVSLISKNRNKKRFMLPIPIGIVYPPLWIIDKLHIPFPISLENLRGYSANSASPHQSTISEFKSKISGLNDLDFMESSLK